MRLASLLNSAALIALGFAVLTLASGQGSDAIAWAFAGIILAGIGVIVKGDQCRK